MRSLIVETWNKPFGKFLYIIAAAILVIAALWKIPQWQVRAYHGRLDAAAISKLSPENLIQLQKDMITAENNARLPLAQIIGGLVVLLGLYATFKNVRVAEEGKLTERFSKAVELLGSEKLDVRLGGIYALERIAHDSQKDHWTVMEVLTAFVREQSENQRHRIKEEKALVSRLNEQQIKDLELPEIKICDDIQAVLTVIGRRHWVEKETPYQRLDLSNTFLEKADFSGANFHQANFTNAELSGANFFNAKMKGANFHQANLTEAFLIRSDLTGAILAGVNFRGALLGEADLGKAILNWARLSGASLRSAKGITWEQLLTAIYDETTQLPPDLEERRKKEQESTALDQ